VEFVIRFRRESALEETPADTLTMWMVLVLPTLSVVLADPPCVMLSRRANAIVEMLADFLTRLTTPGVLEIVTSTTTAITTEVCVMPSKRASVSVVPPAVTLTSLGTTTINNKTVEPLLTSLLTASLVFATPSREVNVTVETAAVSVTVMEATLTARLECAMHSKEVNVREVTAAATLMRLKLSRHKHYRTINRTILLI